MTGILKKRPFLIGVSGGVSSGKSSVCKKIIDEITELNNEHKKQIVVINFDSFYKKLSNEEQAKAERGEYNFDHPSSFDDELAYNTIMDLINGKEIKIPVYDYKTYNFKDNEIIHVRKGDTPDVVIIQGILIFYYPKIRELFKMKLFVDCDADTRLSRRVVRDMNEYHRDLEHILANYTNFVKPAFEEFCLPTKKYADVIIPRGSENFVAINLIVQHIDDLINNMSSVLSSVTSSSAYHTFNNRNSNTYDSLINDIEDDALLTTSPTTSATKRRKSSIDNNSISPLGRTLSFTADQTANKRNELTQSRPH